MKKLETAISEDQYQKLNSIIRKSNSDHLSEGAFGGYELCLRIGTPDIFPASLEIKTIESTELGEVKWKFSKKEL